MRNRKASLSIIFLTIFIDLMGFGILIPILPTFASKDLGVSDFGIGVLIAVFSLMQFIFNPVLGKLSDKIGRRPVILVTQSMTVISYVIFAFSHSFTLLLISRILGGLGGSNIGVAQAYIADITTKEERAKGMGMIGAAFGLGFVFGPVIGAVLSKYGYPVAGFGAAAFSAIALTFALFILPESIKEKSTGKLEIKFFDFRFAKEVITKSSVGYLIILYFMIIFASATVYGTFALLGYKVFHFSDQQIGILFGITGLVGALIQAGFMRTMSKKYGDRTLVIGGLIFMMVGLAFLPYGHNFVGEVIVVSILAIGTGILQPIIPSMISKYSPENQQGAILGVNQSMSALARVFGPLWGGFAFHYLGYESPFISGAIFTLIIIAITFFVLNPERLRVEHNV